MKKFLASVSAIACFSLVLMVPVFAESPSSVAAHANNTTTSTGYTGLNGTMTNDGDTLFDRTIGTRTGTTVRPDTTRGLGNGTINNGFGTYDTNRMLGNNTNGTLTDRDGINGTMNGRGINRTVNRATVRTNNYRATAAANDNDFDWGWLGLIGLAGLAGMRSRNRDEAR